MGLSTSALGKSSWLTLWLTGVLAHFTYVALCGVLILAGLGLPIPEDIPLVFSGYMCNPNYSPIRDPQFDRLIDLNGDGIPEHVPRHIPKLHWMIIAGLCGVLVGDSVVFTIGRHGLEGRGLVARHLRKVMHTKRREKVERHFAKHGNWTVFAGRFMPGFRSIVFGFAGLSRMSYPRFLLIDGMAACISVPTFILLGWYFADRINSLLLWIDRIKHILLPIILVAAVLAVIIYWRQRKRQGGILAVAVSAERIGGTPEIDRTEQHAHPERSPAERLNAGPRLADRSSPAA